MKYLKANIKYSTYIANQDNFEQKISLLHKYCNLYEQNLEKENVTVPQQHVHGYFITLFRIVSNLYKIMELNIDLFSEQNIKNRTHDAIFLANKSILNACIIENIDNYNIDSEEALSKLFAHITKSLIFLNWTDGYLLMAVKFEYLKELKDFRLVAKMDQTEQNQTDQIKGIYVANSLYVILNPLNTFLDHLSCLILL